MVIFISFIQTDVFKTNFIFRCVFSTDSTRQICITCHCANKVPVTDERRNALEPTWKKNAALALRRQSGRNQDKRVMMKGASTQVVNLFLVTIFEYYVSK